MSDSASDVGQAGFYVMVASHGRASGSRLMVFAADSLKAAHRSAEAEYRMDEQLPSNVQVQTEKLHVAVSEDEAVEFCHQLSKVMEESRG